MVRGLVPLGTVAQDDDWYDGGTYDFTESRNWVFPETGFYDALVVDDGADRQSFMIRYRAVTGEVDIGSGREAMVLDPRPTTTGRMNRRPYSDYRFDRGSDLAQLARHALLRDDFRALGGGSNDPLTLLFGEDSGDTVLCRPVTEVVLYRETDLAAAVSTRVDAATGSLYVAGDDPEYDRRVRSPEQQRKIARWLEGDTNFDEEWDMPLGDDQPVARIYSFQRYTARVQEVPLVDLDAVASEYGPGGGQ